MAVFRKNATVTAHAASPTKTGVLVGGTTYASEGVSIELFIQPMSSSMSYDRFGPDIEANWLILAELEDEANLGIGTLVVHGSRRLIVQAKPMPFASGLPTDHIEVALMEQQFKEEPPAAVDEEP